MNKKIKGFTLIEVIIALGILSMIALYLLPSLYSVYSNSNNIKDDSKIFFALQEALEISKDKQIGEYEQTINGVDIYIEISQYDDGLNYISVENGKYSLDMVVKK